MYKRAATCESHFELEHRRETSNGLCASLIISHAFRADKHKPETARGVRSIFITLWLKFLFLFFFYDI